MDDVTRRLKDKAQRARDQFVSERAVLERELASFEVNVKKVDPALVAHIKLPEGGLSAKSLFPSLYEPSLDLDKYHQERQNVIQIFRQFDEVRASLVAKAEAILNG